MCNIDSDALSRIEGCEEELANRHLLVSVMNAAIARCGQDPGRAYALLQIEFDGLARISNTLGRRFAESFVRQAASRLLELSRPIAAGESGPVVSYLGGSTFAVFVDGEVDPFTAVDAAGRIVVEMERPFFAGSTRMISAVNVGIVVSGIGHRDGEEILRDAGIAAKHCRSEGRGACVVFDVPMHLQAVRRLKLEMDIREGLERRQFELFYQPIVALTTGRVRGFEALVRWRHPQQGLVLPGEFIGVAEETGLIVALGEFVTREALGQLAAWRENFPEKRDLQMNINLSPGQLACPDLSASLAAEMARTGVPAGSVCMEVTESMLMQDKASAVRTLGELRGMGVKIAVDDFGTGHSSLASLHEFPLDMLKLDRAFVRRMGEGSGEAVVKAILQIAKSFGLPMTAEGIEGAKEAFALLQMGCEFGQGYCFGRPTPAGGAEKLLGVPAPVSAKAGVVGVVEVNAGIACHI